MQNFALIGIAGYIAPRHLQAIQDTNNNLVAAIDTHDSVGILDKYFPEVSFFTEFERFDRHAEKLKRGPEEGRINYVSICSPNFLHDAHIRFALRIGADAICEKPLVLNPWNLDALEELEHIYGKKVNTILQLRVHPALIQLRENIRNNKNKTKKEVILTYITSRGLWYHFSWKGEKEKSGGIATNIGIHFFDLLMWLFGDVQNSEVHYSDKNKIGGFLELKDANVKWFLSLDKNDLPGKTLADKKTTLRSIIIDGEEVQFSDGFTDLHTKVYERTLSGNGFGIKEARPSIKLVHNIRTAPVIVNQENMHPDIKKVLKIKDN
ncbi:MAG: Gfo/Idh/MocA family oxidoreductase [Ignavibacteriaceae bacterium]|nr:Gfo/Idh/MocA family oxidoreductase [Ignavibacteriaceae bacterium]